MASPIKLLPRCICPVVTRIFASECNVCILNKRLFLGAQEISQYSKILSRFYHNCPFEYRQLDPRRNDSGDDKLIHRSKSSLSFLKGFQKSFTFGRKNEKPKNKNQKRRVPKLILVQNPLTWLMIKIDFSVLRNIWDPSFEEKEFKYGTKQVVSLIDL